MGSQPPGISKQNGHAIRVFRQLAGWSLDHLANAATLSRSHLNLVELEASGISNPALRRVASALDVTTQAICRDPDGPYSHNGATMRAVREKLHIGPEELAERLGVSTQDLLDIEEQRETPSYELLSRIAHQLGTTAETFQHQSTRQRRARSA